jgi:hypothetical protein
MPSENVNGYWFAAMVEAQPKVSISWRNSWADLKFPTATLSGQSRLPPIRVFLQHGQMTSVMTTYSQGKSKRTASGAMYFSV